MRICLNMIVKDEAAVIERCLRSVKSHVDSWAIVDTGSSDGTQEIVRAFLKDIPGELIERPWVDFSTNRNEALQLARGRGDYAFFIDADDALQTDPGFSFGSLGAPGYVIESVVAGISSWIVALARLDIDWVWRGVLHEILSAQGKVPNTPLHGARIAKFADGARSRLPARAKYARDAELLRAALAREPGNTRYQFYLAQSLREAGQWAEAIEAYRRRSLAGGSEEEIYFCKLMIAVLGEQTGWAAEAIVATCLDAWRYRPQRAEAPMRLAHFFLKQRLFVQARDCALAAIALPPTSDRLLVDRTAWGWRPRDDLALALFHLGDEAGCIGIYRQMLDDPELPPGERERVERNLAKLAAE
ncbi:glycosyltransferase [Rudaea sp.]|uniref:glycosyltransferase n=1 Tax=Rudaea sp. TaxID=2136325 RepID=UPI002ED29CCB